MCIRDRYTDGSATMPARPEWARAGAACWVPGGNQDMLVSEMADFVWPRQRRDGFMLTTRLGGQRPSSARAELA
eukprot:12946405-Alexandrium_andersonii.AAC.1